MFIVLWIIIIIICTFPSCCLVDFLCHLPWLYCFMCLCVWIRGAGYGTFYFCFSFSPLGSYWVFCYERPCYWQHRGKTWPQCTTLLFAVPSSARCHIWHCLLQTYIRLILLVYVPKGVTRHNDARWLIIYLWYWEGKPIRNIRSHNVYACMRL